MSECGEGGERRLADAATGSRKPGAAGEAARDAALGRTGGTLAGRAGSTNRAAAGAAGGGTADITTDATAAATAGGVSGGTTGGAAGRGPGGTSADRAGRAPQGDHDTSPAARSLLRQRRFAPFFWTQCAGAMNDNVYKVGLATLVTFDATRYGGLDPRLAGLLISACFVLPFVLLSATAGQLADRMQKARLVRIIKSAEIGIMLLAAAGLLLHLPAVLYLCVLLMGVHSTFFGPVKYAYLPEQLAPAELLSGNALVETSTFIAILLGNVAGSVGAAWGSAWLAVCCVVLALLGRLAAAGVPVTPPAAPGLRIDPNPLRETWANLRLAGRDHVLLACLLGISWLWFLGATFLSSVFAYASQVLHADASVVTLMLALFSIGVGLGATLCPCLAPGRQALAMVAVGALGMTLFTADFALAGMAEPATSMAPDVDLATFLREPRHWRVLVDLLLLSVASGLYSVPLYTFMQARSPLTHRARIVAANNIVNSLFMIASAVLGGIFAAVGWSLPALFLTLAVGNVLMAALLLRMVPRFRRALRLWGGRVATRGRRAAVR
ncbi:MFS transporter [Chitinasiproducens palmae]|uniref:Major Facilitator Superfamily protein n=1 Tax=Chitinasiproducens palmae TaxID=1770053 RepID=A0A1H2PV06_9BURK|nr:MFS transporter [Chitinasiproducens palmae]SDV51053.1 Major Facilitator Superfamily protein [Chitinasiproducens palmae]